MLSVRFAEKKFEHLKKGYVVMARVTAGSIQNVKTLLRKVDRTMRERAQHLT